MESILHFSSESDGWTFLPQMQCLILIHQGSMSPANDRLHGVQTVQVAFPAVRSQNLAFSQHSVGMECQQLAPFSASPGKGFFTLGLLDIWRKTSIPLLGVSTPSWILCLSVSMEKALTVTTRNDSVDSSPHFAGTWFHVDGSRAAWESQPILSFSILNDSHVSVSFIPPNLNSLSSATRQKVLPWPGSSDFEVSSCWLQSLLASNVILETWVESGLS